MADKPSEGHLGWISDDDTDKYVAPSAAKRLQGWIQAEKPPFQYFNWAWRLIDRWLQYFEAATDDNAAAITTEASARAGADSTHAALTAPHSATSAATADRLMMRDASGRAKVAAPSASDDIARKNEVDAEAAARANADTALQTNIDTEATARAGADSAHATLTAPHSATSAATAGRIMMRDANGRAKVAAPSAPDDIARKYEVDAEATTRASADSAHAALTAPHSATSANTASRIVMRDGSGDIIARLFRTEYESTTAGQSYFLGQNAIGAGADNYARPMTVAQALSILGLTNALVVVAQSLGANGYIRFGKRDGSAGPLIQWGRYSSIPATSSVNITFPMSFTTSVLATFVSVEVATSQTGSFRYDPHTVNPSLTGMGLDNNDLDAKTMNWLAIGY